MTAECASSIEETEQANAQHDTLGACNYELEGAAATPNGELGPLGRSVLSLKGLVTAGADGAKTAEAQARKMLDRMF